MTDHRSGLMFRESVQCLILKHDTPLDILLKSVGSDNEGNDGLQPGYLEKMTYCNLSYGSSATSGEHTLQQLEEAKQWLAQWDQVRVVYKSNFQTFDDSIIADNADSPNGFTPGNWNNAVHVPDEVFPGANRSRSLQSRTSTTATV